MRTLLIIAGVIVGAIILLIAALVIIGYRLPVHHSASRSIRLSRPVKEVYSRIRDFSSSPDWRTSVKKVEMLGETDGRLRFKEHGPSDTLTYELVQDVPERLIVTRIVDQDLGYSGSWTYGFSSAEARTLLRITEDGDVSNPLFRFMSRYVFGHTATIDQYLSDLSKSFDEHVEIQD